MPFPNRLSGPLAIVVLLLSSMAGGSLFADDTPAADSPADEKSAIGAEILEVNAEGMTARSFEALRSVMIKVRATNQSDKPVEIRASDVTLTCDGAQCRLNTIVPDPLLSGDRTLAPGEEITGWLAFPVIHQMSDEPPLELSWTVSGRIHKWSVNAEVRRLMNLRTELIGPEDCLAVLTLNDTDDLKTIWVLSKEFRDLHTAGIRRVVVIGTSESSSPRHGQVVSWLSTAREGAEENRLPFNSQARSPVQFPEFHAAGFGGDAVSYRGNRGFRNSGATDFLHTDRERAVAAALRDVFLNQPLERALAGLQSPEAGIRRVALSTSIDRLTPEQLQSVIADASSGSNSQQVLVAELLSQVAYPGVVEALHDFVQSDDQDISQAALSSLVRCLSPETDRVVQEVWLESAGKPGFRGRVVNEMLSADDDRWIAYVRESAEELLNRAAPELADPLAGAAQSAAVSQLSPNAEAPTQPTASADADRGDATAAGLGSAPLTASESQQLQRILAFFEEHEEPGFNHFARARVLHLEEREIQDRVLKFLLNFSNSTDAELARLYIDQRLPEGTVTDRLLATITQFPDKRYTESLIELSKKESLRPNERNNLLTAAIHCATGHQMDPLIDEFHALEDSAQTLLLQQLALSDHPRWLELAESSLGASPSRDGAILRLLGSNPSPESLNLLLKLLENVRLKAASDAEFDRHDSSLAQNLIAQVSLFSHPEARRLLNRCYISPSVTLRGQARLALQRSLQKSPGVTDYIRMDEETRQRRYPEALEAANAAITKDPFLADAMHSRASLYLRDNRVHLALQDLVEANRLNPEDTVAESTLAIAQVRAGDVTDGLAYAEEILARVPVQAANMRMITLYNAACAYARTDEVPGIADADRTKYLDRAVALVSASVDAGFDEVDHVENDPDLDSLRSRPEWNSLLQRMAEAQKKPARDEEE